WDEAAETLRPVWASGVNTELGFVWAKIRRPGLYVPIGLTRDRLLAESIRSMAYARRVSDIDDPDERERITKEALTLFLQPKPQDVEELRRVVARFEVGSSPEPVRPAERRSTRGGHIAGFHLPGGAEPESFVQRLRKLKTPPGGLPEEHLFYPPDVGQTNAP